MSLINFNSISMHYVCVHRHSIHTVYSYRGFIVLTVVSCHANSGDDPHPPSASVSQWAMVLFFVLILRTVGNMTYLNQEVESSFVWQDYLTLSTLIHLKKKKSHS